MEAGGVEGLSYTRKTTVGREEEGCNDGAGAGQHLAGCWEQRGMMSSVGLRLARSLSHSPGEGRVTVRRV